MLCSRAEQGSRCNQSWKALLCLAGPATYAKCHFVYRLVLLANSAQGTVGWSPVHAGGTNNTEGEVASLWDSDAIIQIGAIDL